MVPGNKGSITQTVLRALRESFDDPAVLIIEVKANFLLIRVDQDRGGPRYFHVKISEAL